ncbi:MAG TPA: hypothetical protein VJ249_05160 [Candidatus Bathyarchaeia archaeon]|nr:hypothetical protein [Candidatus Bathyarchaeia archaeon]
MTIRLSESLKKIVDVSEEKESELKDKLVGISQKEGAVVMACIAPYVGKKVSPTRTLTASMGISEEFAIETVIEQIRARTEARKLYLLLNSPGGLVDSSYKVARALRRNFEVIKVFVPHIAASGGTLVAVAGNEIVMGMMSQLSPVDPSSKGSSAKHYVDGFQTVTDFFKRTSEEDAPYTYKVLAQKYEAEQLDSAVSALVLMENYLVEILTGSGHKNPAAKKIAHTLVQGFLTHGEVINLDKAKEAGLNVAKDDKYPEEWSIMREWLGNYLLQSADKHVIRYVISANLKKTNTKKNKREKKLKS